MNQLAHVAYAGRSLVDAIRENLLDRILNGTLPPNQTLQERPLAASLGVSRTPLREALRQLEGERFVGRRDDGSMFVRPITVEELLEVLHIRSLLEADAGARAAGRIDKRRLAELRDRIVTIRDAAERDAAEQDIVEHGKIDRELHDMIAFAGGGELMRAILADLRRRTRIFSMQRIPSRFVPVCNEHLAIVDALASEQPEASSTAVRNHLVNVRESIIQWLKHS